MPPEAPELAPLRAMLAVLPKELREEFAMTLYRVVNAPPPAGKGRVLELHFLARLLDERPQPPETLPYVERTEYDARRRAESESAAPSSSRLVKRYGSWQLACYAAFGIRDDGRRAFGEAPWLRRPIGEGKPKKFTTEECIAAVQECAVALGHVPSGKEFQQWQLAMKRSARALGRTARVASLRAVLRELAPARGQGLGWKAVVQTIFGDE
jgi:hypothetical protein